MAASYFFYMKWEPWYVLLLLFSTLITYFGGRILDKTTDDKKRKTCLVVVIFLELALLIYFKYSEMLIQYINIIFLMAGWGEKAWDCEILLPVGISFFTLQSLGYLIDIYRRETYAERNLLRYALFVSFFPQLVAGPIERSKNLLKQLAKTHRFSFDEVQKGLVLMLYGFFLKVVIADRIAIVVDVIYGEPELYRGGYLVVATVLFAFQIYCDFYGYSTIARGAALTMGIRLVDNFNAPYFAGSIREFWRRWHISLSEWFRDYLYIPLGGNRKGVFRQCVNLTVVFAISGLWHGASMSFVIWGLLHGIYQVMGVVWEKYFGGSKKSTSRGIGGRFAESAITFILVCFAWVFFRAGSLAVAYDVLSNMLPVNNFFEGADCLLFELGVEEGYFCILLLSAVILGVVDYQKHKGCDVIESFFSCTWWFKMIAVIGLVMMILLFGCYGTDYDAQQFIYFQF